MASSIRIKGTAKNVTIVSWQLGSPAMKVDIPLIFGIETQRNFFHTLMPLFYIILQTFLLIFPTFLPRQYRQCGQ